MQIVKPKKHYHGYVDRNFILSTILNNNFTSDYVIVYLTDAKHLPIGQLNIYKALQLSKRGKLSLNTTALWSDENLCYAPSGPDLSNSTYTIETVHNIYSTNNSKKLWRKLNTAAKALINHQTITFQ